MSSTLMRVATAEMRRDAAVETCRPHSDLPLPDQRPARASSPSWTGRVHGQQPIDA